MLYAGAALLAVFAAAGNNIGKVLQKQATDSLPQLAMERKVLYSYVMNQTWRIGFLADVGGAILTIVALSMAPVSVIQPISGTGLAILAIFSHYYLHERLNLTEWVGIGFAMLGAVGVGLTAAPSINESLFTGAAIVLLFMMLSGLFGLEMLSRHTTRQMTLEFVAGIQGGVFFGLSASSSRMGLLLTQQLAIPIFAPAGLSLSIIFTSFGLFCQTRGMKDGRAVIVCTFAAISSIVTGVVVGLVALNESIPQSSLACVGWCTSLGSIIAGIMLLMKRSAITAPADPALSKHIV